MVYTIFTNDGAFEFDRLCDLLEAAEESARTEIDRETGETVKEGVSWNDFSVHYESEDGGERHFRFLDNGRDIFRSPDGVLLDKMISRFVLQPVHVLQN